jgi:GrpB-like predicted nucleotidyltransferase (UPF0157 family)
MRSESEGAAALRWIVETLRRQDIPYAVCGGLAAIAYGSRRRLNDIDIFVPEAGFDAIVNAGRALVTKDPARRREGGWDVKYVQFTCGGQKIEVGSTENARILDASAGAWLDFALSFEACRDVRLLGQVVRVMGLVELIDCKRTLGRDVDREDIGAIRARAADARNEFVVFSSEQEVHENASRLFDCVKHRLTRLLPYADVQHVGSTAIPGSLTKGDLDIQVRVTSEEYEAARRKLLGLYAVNAGGFCAADAVSFEDYGTRPPHGVHLTAIGGSGDIQWKFRDVLMASPELRREYDRLKERHDGGRMDVYRGAKEIFVDKVARSPQYKSVAAGARGRERMD